MTNDSQQPSQQSAQELRVADERAITDTAIRYTWALDGKAFGELDDVFLPNATANLGSPDRLVGREAIVDKCSTALGKFAASQHLVGNHQVSIDGDAATHRCYLQAQHIRANGALWMVGGRYEDEMVRTGDGWRIQHRDLIVMWTSSDTSAVVAESSESPDGSKNERGAQL